MVNKTTFWGWKSYKKNIEPHRNFTGFYKNGVETLNAYKKNIEPHQNFPGFCKKGVEALIEL